jgi:ABC-2 type transport system ATP-binding protein
MTPTPVAIELAGVSRTFSTGSTRRIALDNVRLTISTGEIHGLLGPNGAGKTTLAKILSTVLLPTSGSAKVLGHDVAEEAKRVKSLVVLVLGGERGLYGRLSVRDNLSFWAGLYGLRRRDRARRVTDVLARVGLQRHGDQRVDTMSRGMKQRLHLARGLVAGTPVVILDEPTSGMDPVSAHAVRTLITSLAESSRTVLLMTHDMAEATVLCDRVSLLDSGRVLSTSDPQRLATMLPPYRLDVRDVSDVLADEVEAEPGVDRVEHELRGWSRFICAKEQPLRTAAQRLLAAGLVELSLSRPSLEDIYLDTYRDRGMVVER